MQPRQMQCTHKFFYNDLKPRKVGQVDLFVSDQGALVRLCVQYYKSLCAAVMISFTLVNRQAQSHRQRLTSLYDKLSQ